MITTLGQGVVRLLMPILLIKKMDSNFVTKAAFISFASRMRFLHFAYLDDGTIACSEWLEKSFLDES